MPRPGGGRRSAPLGRCQLLPPRPPFCDRGVERSAAPGSGRRSHPAPPFRSRRGRRLPLSALPPRGQRRPPSGPAPPAVPGDAAAPGPRPRRGRDPTHCRPPHSPAGSAGPPRRGSAFRGRSFGHSRRSRRGQTGRPGPRRAPPPGGEAACAAGLSPGRPAPGSPGPARSAGARGRRIPGALGQPVGYSPLCASPGANSARSFSICSFPACPGLGIPLSSALACTACGTRGFGQGSPGWLVAACPPPGRR